MVHSSTSPEVQSQGNFPDEWQNWFLICLAGQAIFIPLIFLLKGPWSTRRAREEAEAHERLVDEEMSRLHITEESVD